MRRRAAAHRRARDGRRWARAPAIHRLRRGHRSGHHPADEEQVATDAGVEDGDFGDRRRGRMGWDGSRVGGATSTK
jgi:hypothetical protein